MKIEELIKTLEEYNNWRRGAKTKMIAPAIIGEAIDEAIKVIKEKFPVCPKCKSRDCRPYNDNPFQCLVCGKTWM